MNARIVVDGRDGLEGAPAPRRHRFRRVVRIGGGWLLIVVAAIAMLGAPRTAAAPSIDCGKPSLLLMFDRHAADVPASRVNDCQAGASSTVLGALFFLAAPGVLLLGGPRLMRRYRHARDRNVARGAGVSDPTRFSRLAPRPVEVTITSRLGEDAARERLRLLGNGGPPGSLRVREVVPPYVDARLVAANSPRFAGTLSPIADGSQLRGLIRPSRDDGFRIGFMMVGAVVMGIVGGAILLISASSGHINLGFIPILALAVFFGCFSAGTRRLSERAFPTAANALSAALAAALDTTAPHMPGEPLSPRTATAFTFGVFGLQLVAVAARVALTAGPLLAVVVSAAFALVLALTYRASTSWRPRLYGTELHVGFRHINLVAVTDVRARGALMALSDGRTRVVVSSALGRPEVAAQAETTLISPPADVSAKLLDAARLVQAVAGTAERCPLDERTATTLHRATSLSGPPARGPRFNPAAVAPLAVMLGGTAITFALLAALH